MITLVSKTLQPLRRWCEMKKNAFYIPESFIRLYWDITFSENFCFSSSDLMLVIFPLSRQSLILNENRRCKKNSVGLTTSVVRETVNISEGSSLGLEIK